MQLSNESHLFRFRANNDNTINELTNNVIWHSKMAALNDPFEMFFEFDYDTLRKMSPSDIAKIIKDSVFYRDQKEKIIQLFLQKNFEPIYQVIYDVWGEDFKNNMLKEFHSAVAVACFTKAFDSRLMWGYYGSGMQGICFAYNKDKLDRCGIALGSVTYQSHPPKIDIFRHLLERLRKNQVTIDGQFSLIKHTDWEKEEEVRSVKYLSKSEYDEKLPGLAVALDERCIDAVIIGERLTGEKRDLIKDFSRENGIKLLFAHADFTSYKVQISEHQR